MTAASSHPRIARAADRERHRARSWHGGRSSLRFGRDVRAKRPLYRGAQKTSVRASYLLWNGEKTRPPSGSQR